MPCRSWLENTGVYCYARVMRETCSQSATDVNMLMTIMYNAKWTRVVNEWCKHGKTLLQTIEHISGISQPATIVVSRKFLEQFEK